MQTLFWVATAFVFYTYLGYPLLLLFWTRVMPRPVSRGGITPLVSVVIAAHNEERVMARRLDNLLAQQYPADRYQIIVVSDGSTDGTEQIVGSFSDRRVVLVRLEERCGKAVALNHGVAAAGGEIVVFTDARQSFAPDALKLLVANFCDPVVGCVSGELILFDEVGRGTRVEMGAYWRYEKGVRRLESASGSAVGATGAVYAIRKRLYRPLPPGIILDDVLTPMNVSLQGYRVVFDTAPKAYDHVSKGMEEEWVRKVRTLAGNFQLLGGAPMLLAPWRCALWWRFLSHKVFRLLVPFALLSLLVSSLCCQGACYRALLTAQLLFYLTVLAGFLIPPLRKVRLVNLSFFFMVMNLATLAGLWHWASGRCSRLWRPAYAK